MQITYELVVPENVIWNGSETVDGAETMTTLCQLHSLTKYRISVSAVTTTGGPKVLGRPQVVSFWTGFVERPSRPAVVSVSHSTATLSVKPLESVVANPVVYDTMYIVMYSRNNRDRVGPPITRQGSHGILVGSGWYFGSRLTTEQLNRSRTVELGGNVRTELEPGVNYSVSLLAITYMVDGDVVISYSWPPISLTTLTLTTSTKTTSTDPGTSDHHSTSGYVDATSTMTTGNAKESTVTRSHVASSASSIVNKPSVTTTEPPSSPSSATSNVSVLGSSLATAVSAREEITTEKPSLSSPMSPLSSYLSSDSSSAANPTPRVQGEVTSLSQLTRMTSSDGTTAVFPTHQNQLSTSRRLMTSVAVELMTSLTTGATSETRSSSPPPSQTVTTDRQTSRRLTTTQTPFIHGEIILKAFKAPLF